MADALWPAHSELLRDLSRLEETVGSRTVQGLAELQAALAATRAHIAEHFHFEEENGYLEAVRQRAPQHDRVIQGLLEEHHQLTAALDKLIEEIRKASSLDEALKAKVRVWIAKVRLHEAQENRLVQQVFNQDTPAED